MSKSRNLAKFTSDNEPLSDGVLDKSDIGLSDVDNVSASDLRDRSTHTGNQTLSTISDAGTIASQDADSVNIDGGNIDGTPIGANSADEGNFTTLDASGDVNFDSGTLFVDASESRVGIGNTSANASLDIKPGFNAEVLDLRCRTTNDFAFLRFKSNDGSENIATIGAQRLSANVGNLRFSTGSSEAMRIDSSGNVGIGTTAPDHKLTVASAPDTTTATNGADFFTDPPGLTVTQINSTSTGLGKTGIVQNNSGDFHIRSFWGFSIDKGSGNLAQGADNSVNGDDRTFAIRQYAGGTTWNTQFSVNAAGNCNISGALSKGSGSFKINHPLKPETHHLIHSFIEGPQADLIYRGQVDLVNGQATVNIDKAGRMSEGTFEALNCNVQCFTTNEDGWTCVRGTVTGNILTIEAEDNTCTDTISWMVIGERCDQHMIDTDWTDENGRVITEPEKDENDES